MKPQAINFSLIGYSLLTLVISFFTYFRHYDQPANLFWDENYHLASAQKYLDRVMFMEHHPPLGKMFIALGEYLFRANQGADTGLFLTSDYVKTIPAHYSFTGVRFFPTLFATLGAVVFFLILYEISGYPRFSFLFSSLYLFENALIVHSRGAMLESVQLFFMLLSLWCFLILFNRDRLNLKNWFWLGVLVGLGVAVKLTGLLLVLLFPALFVAKHHLDCRLILVKEFVRQGFMFWLGGALVFVGAYYLHFRLGAKVLGDRYYQASTEYRQILETGNIQGLYPFVIALRDNLKYIPHYEGGVPKYDPCKAGENGSLPFAWPFGHKSINYRWEKTDGQVRYLYLQGNPIIWFTGLAGVILASSLCLSRLVFHAAITNQRLFYLIKFLVVVYWVYLGAMARIDRVLYLYHYFVPLLISLLLAFVLFLYLFEKAIARADRKILIGVILFVLLILWSYRFFSPLTYYQPLSTEEFQARQWFDFWRLKPVL